MTRYQLETRIERQSHALWWMLGLVSISITISLALWDYTTTLEARIEADRGMEAACQLAHLKYLAVDLQDRAERIQFGGQQVADTAVLLREILAGESVEGEYNGD